MYYWIIPLVLGILSLIAFLIFRVKEKRLIAVILKGTTSIFFILTALLAWLSKGTIDTLFGLFVVIGLLFGLGGDIFLDLKFMSKKYEDLYTRLGFISFSIQHIFLSIGLFTYFYQKGEYGLEPLYIVIPAILTLVFMAIVLIMEKVTPVKYGNMKPFAIGYGLVLFFTMNAYCSFAIFYKFQVITLILMAVGLIFFTLSDMILNNTYFKEGCNTPMYVISNHICYYLAQFLIAISLFFVVI